MIKSMSVGLVLVLTVAAHGTTQAGQGQARIRTADFDVQDTQAESVENENLPHLLRGADVSLDRAQDRARIPDAQLPLPGPGRGLMFSDVDRNRAANGRAGSPG